MLHTSKDTRNPGLRTLPPGVERYLVRGGGLSVIDVLPEDRIEIINEEITSEDLQQVIQSSAGKFFKDIKIFDVYQGKGIAEDKKSIALTISWQSMKNTLLDSEIDQAVEKIVNSVKTKLGGELRI